MNSSAATRRPLLIESNHGVVLSYDDILRQARHPSRYHPTLRSSSAAQTIESILLALARGVPLTLIDSDLSRAEIESLGIAPETLTKMVEAPARSIDSLSALLSAALKPSRFRLTLYTSGSTGLPKKVTHDISSLARRLRTGGGHQSDVWGLAYNPTHIAGVQVALQAFFNGNVLVQLFQQSSAVVRQLIERYGVTHLSATPSFYRLLLHDGGSLADVRSITLGGERSDANLIGRLGRLFPNARIRNLYASTEAGTLLSSEDDVFTVPSDLEHRFRIVDDVLEVHRELLAKDAEGLPRGDWYSTGDVVEILSQSPVRFRFLARRSDFVNVGGNKANPLEVEQALESYPGVSASRVFGRPNSVLGHILCAEVVAANEIQEHELRSFLSERLQPFKIPRFIRFVENLERTRTGKLKRR